MKKAVKYSLWGLGGIVAIGIAVALWGWKSLTSSPFDITETTYLYIRPMDTENDVRQQLQEVAQARSMNGWTVARWLTDFHPRTGRYGVEPGESMLSVFRKLKHGQQTPVRFTIPSVRRLEKLAGIMANKLMLDSADVAFAFSDSIFASNYGYSVATLPALFIWR